MRHFVIVYNRRSGRVRIDAEFPTGHSRDALNRRFELERDHRGDPSTEIVVLSSRRESDLRKTHARYFKTGAELIGR